jgi:hypothetical protein
VSTYILHHTHLFKTVSSKLCCPATKFPQSTFLVSDCSKIFQRCIAIRYSNIVKLTFIKYKNLPLPPNIETPEWFLPLIKTIINTKIDPPSHPPLKFALSEEAAIHNMNILRNHGDSIENLIQAYPGSFLSPGSEFRPVYLLEQLFMHHHNWCLIRNSLSKGSVWPLLPISDEDRMAKNIEFIARGNHKSASKYDRELAKIITEEISQGWSMY